MLVVLRQVQYQIIQMYTQKLRILLIVAVLIILQTYALELSSHCLNNCHLCDPRNPFICSNEQLNCQWGHYDPYINGNCIPLPFMKVIYDKDAQKLSQKFVQKQPGWIHDATKQKCVLKFQEQTKQIQICGPFTGMTKTQRGYKLDEISQVYAISFNLIRNRWIPSNDYLSLEIISQQNLIQIQQIKDHIKYQFKDIQYEATCGQTRVFIDKYSIIINNKDKKIKNDLTISFSSFLADAMWGISNVKIVSGCNNFLIYNQTTNKCDYCEDKFYLSSTYHGQLRCQPCPLLCLTCTSQKLCTTCAPNSYLKEGSCQLSANYPMDALSFFHNAIKSSCGNFNFILGSQGNKIESFILRNPDEPQFNQLALLTFTIYYNPNSWDSQSEQRIKIIINGKQFQILNSQNLTNKGSHRCKEIKGNRLAKMTFNFENVTVKNRYLTVAFQLVDVNDKEEINFGVSDVYVLDNQKRDVSSHKAAYIQVDTHKVNKIQRPSSHRPKQFKLFLSSSNKDQQLDQQPLEQLEEQNQPQQDSPSPATNKNSDSTKKADQPTIFIMNNDNKKDQLLKSNVPVNSNPIMPQLINSTIQAPLQKVNTTQTTTISNSNPNSNSMLKPITNNIQMTFPSSSKTITPTLNPTPTPTLTTTNTTTTTTPIAKIPVPVPAQAQASVPTSVPISVPVPAPAQASVPTSVPISVPVPVPAPVPASVPTIIPIPAPIPAITPIPQNNVPVPSSNNTSATNSLKSINDLDHTIKAHPSTIRNTSGLQILINNFKDTRDINQSIEIDQLQKHQYQIQSYKVIENTLYIFVTVRKSFKNGLLTVRNLTNMNETKQTTGRLLVTQNVVAQINVSRYDHLSSNDISSISSFSVLFHIFAWIALIAIILMVLLGIGIVSQENVISLQILFLHTFISLELLPLSFKNVVSGLNILENLNFFILQINSVFGDQWIGNIFKSINDKLNFTHQISAIILINVIYLIWFGFIVLSRMIISKFDLATENNGIMRIFNKIVTRKVNFVDQIWRYQFIAIFWTCFTQFKSFSQINQASNNQMFNYAVSLSILLLFITWPTFVIFYTRISYYQAQYSSFIEFFEDIFYKKIPTYHLPSKHHRVVYPIFRYGKYLVFVALIAFEIAPLLTLPLLMLLNIIELAYITKENIYTDPTYFKFRIIENIVMIIIEVLMLMLNVMYDKYSSKTFITLGYVLSGVSVLILLNSLIRMMYLAKEKYSAWIGVVFEEMPEQMQNKLKYIQN